MFYTKDALKILLLGNISRVKTLTKNANDAQCLKIAQKVAFNIASEASSVYILSKQKFIKNAKNGPKSFFNESILSVNPQHDILLEFQTQSIFVHIHVNFVSYDPNGLEIIPFSP